MKKPLAHVTDHAVLCHLERVKGVDIEAVRLELGHLVDAAIEAGAAATTMGGIRYVLVGDQLVSCSRIKPRTGRTRRRRELPEDTE